MTMKNLKKSLLISVLSVTAVVSSLPVYATTEPTAAVVTTAASEKQVIVVHLSKFTNDLHAAMMAVKLAKALQEQGAAVTLFLDLEGVRLVDTRQPQDLSWGSGDSHSVNHMYDAFVKAGGKILVCPHCAKSAGMTAETLRTGAIIAKDAGEIADLLISASKILDY
jgi:predicted peroxiredoxin